MIVSCPECGARYRLADGAIPAEGRAMRCAGCKHRWFEMGPEPDDMIPPPPPEPLFEEPETDLEPPPPAPAPEPAPPPPLVEVAHEDEDEPRRGHPVLKTLFAILLGAAFSAGAAAMWVPNLPPLDLSAVPWLDELVNPPTAPASPLTLAFTTDAQPVAGGRTLYALSVTLANPTASPQSVPPITGKLVEADGAVAYRWAIAAPAVTLAPGQTVVFDASALGPPGERVIVTH